MRTELPRRLFTQVTHGLARPLRTHENELPRRLFSHQCVELDFSHLEVKGINTLPIPLHNKR
jgi:hypothetical protein